ncbi:MAG: hypothetical protein WDM78_16735 [Puia sp.]
MKKPGRLIILKYADYFGATDEELYQSLPDSLNKIMVLDEWHHQEYYLQLNPFEDPAFMSRLDMNQEPMKQYAQEERARRNHTTRMNGRKTGRAFMRPGNRSQM